MFVLPALIVPLVFILALYRLVQIPRKLLSGELRIPARHRILLSIASALAYLTLLAYTVALSIALVHAVFLMGDRWSAYLPLLGYVLAYPVVYVAAAWVFFYGLKPNKPEERHGN